MSEKNRSQARSIHIFTEKFSEGEWHTFRVIKLMQIPGEEWYFLMQSPQGNRLLMPSRFYPGYQIRIGEILSCRIDKISCSGEIFLEPAHPYYKPGESYTFQVKDKEMLTDRKGRSFISYELSGDFNGPAYATLMEDLDLALSATITAKVLRIRKGVLILSDLKVMNNC